MGTFLHRFSHTVLIQPLPETNRTNSSLVLFGIPFVALVLRPSLSCQCVKLEYADWTYLGVLGLKAGFHVADPLACVCHKGTAELGDGAPPGYRAFLRLTMILYSHGSIINSTFPSTAQCPGGEPITPDGCLFPLAVSTGLGFT